MLTARRLSESGLARRWGWKHNFLADGTCIQNSTSGTYQIVEQGGAKYSKMDFKIVATMYEIVTVSPNFIKLKEGENSAPTPTVGNPLSR